MIFTVIFVVLLLVCGYIAFKDDNHDEWGNGGPNFPM